jgi:tRNA-specific adenosine deaminase 3
VACFHHKAALHAHQDTNPDKRFGKSFDNRSDKRPYKKHYKKHYKKQYNRHAQRSDFGTYQRWLKVWEKLPVYKKWLQAWEDFHLFYRKWLKVWKKSEFRRKSRQAWRNLQDRLVRIIKMAEGGKSIKKALAAQEPIVQELVQEDIEHGVLIPLKTTLELRDEYQTGHVLITRAPTKAANPIIMYVVSTPPASLPPVLSDPVADVVGRTLREVFPEEIIKSVPHLRRCAKPSDLPVHLKARFMNESPQSRQIHTGKSNWIYIIVGPESMIDRNEVMRVLSAIEGMEEGVFLESIPVPMVSPTSQVQAAMWSQQFWPALYRKNHPLGPHPAMIARQTDEIAGDAAIWMGLAHRMAQQTAEAGFGEPIGVCIIQREEGKTRLVALAADCRWRYQDRNVPGCTGNPMAHAAMRAISMVAQKLVRAEKDKAETKARAPPMLEFEAFQDEPVLPDEKRVFHLEHPNPDGYLCHGLEMYLTHEPCVMCSMAILHSRMGKVVFRHRMPLTGGMCAEDRGSDHPALNGADGGRGLGLFWRRELNWSMVAWEWESSGCLPPLRIDKAIHA